MTDLDSRLHRAGEHWRDHLDPDPSLDDLFANRPHRTRWLHTAAVAAAVAVVLLGAGALLFVRTSSNARDGRTQLGGATATHTNRGPSTRVLGPSRPSCLQQLTPPELTTSTSTSFVIRLVYTGSGICSVPGGPPATTLLNYNGIQVASFVDTTLVGYGPLLLRTGDAVVVPVTVTGVCDATVRLSFVPTQPPTSVPISLQRSCSSGSKPTVHADRAKDLRHGTSSTLGTLLVQSDDLADSDRTVVIEVDGRDFRLGGGQLLELALAPGSYRVRETVRGQQCRTVPLVVGAGGTKTVYGVC